MCCSLRAAHLSLISGRPYFNGFHMDPKLCQMDPEKMKRCPCPYLWGDLLQWKEIPKGTEQGNAVKDSVPRRNLSWNFIFSTCPPRECVCLHDQCQTLGCYSFSLHMSSCPTCHIKHGWCHGESFVSVPEITLIPVKLTLCKVSRQMLNPGFSILIFH